MKDKKLRELIDEREVMKKNEDAVIAARKAVDAKIIKELDERKTKSLTMDDGLKVTRATQKRTTYSFEKLVGLIGATKAKKYQAQAVDKEALAAGIGEGKVAPDVLSGIAEVTESAPWIQVSGT